MDVGEKQLINLNMGNGVVVNFYVLKHHGFLNHKYKCVYCNKIAEHIHHIKPQKLEPFFALDPDYVISVCKDCHHEYSHSDKDCTYGAIANTMCSEDYI